MGPSQKAEKIVRYVAGISRRLNEINRDSPQIPKWAWKSVKKQQEEGSTTYKADRGPK